MKARLLALLAALSLVAAAHADNGKPEVLIKTNQGDITVTLNAEKAPKTVANFLRYVDEGFYNGTIFHRVIPGFMIQGGGLTPDMQKKPTHDGIENEAKNGLKNVRGSIAMARTSDPHSATSQFFINHRNNSNLDYPSFDGWGYAVFGMVTKGMDVVDKIADVPTARRDGRKNVPEQPVVIESITRLPQEKS
jgi:cyclophilin family peptidyl-prolyl cis-trans isomerase